MSIILVRNYINVRRVWRYQRGNQNPYIAKEQTTQWPKEKVQKNKRTLEKTEGETKTRQSSDTWDIEYTSKSQDEDKQTKNTQHRKLQKWATVIPLKNRSESRCSWRVSSSFLFIRRPSCFSYNLDHEKLSNITLKHTLMKQCSYYSSIFHSLQQ